MYLSLRLSVLLLFLAFAPAQVKARCELVLFDKPRNYFYHNQNAFHSCDRSQCRRMVLGAQGADLAHSMSVYQAVTDTIKANDSSVTVTSEAVVFRQTSNSDGKTTYTYKDDIWFQEVRDGNGNRLNEQDVFVTACTNGKGANPFAGRPKNGICAGHIGAATIWIISLTASCSNNAYLTGTGQKPPFQAVFQQGVAEPTIHGKFQLKNVAWNKNLNLQVQENRNDGRPNVYSPASHPDQEWNIYYLGNGYVKLANENYKKRCLNLQGGQARDGGTVGVWECAAHDDQEWEIVRLGGANKIKLKKKGHNVCLNLQSHENRNGGAPNVWTCADHSDQEWFLETV